jgi:hypothetical protein
MVVRVLVRRRKANQPFVGNTGIARITRLSRTREENSPSSADPLLRDQGRAIRFKGGDKRSIESPRQIDVSSAQA